MPELKIESGIKEYDLNGKVTVLFNPTDTMFIERCFDTFSSLDDIQTSFQEKVTQATDNATLFTVAKEMDAEIRGKINALFGFDVCTPLLGDMSICALAGGLPIWANIMLAMIDEMDGSFANEKKQRNPRLDKYIKKYKK